MNIDSLHVHTGTVARVEMQKKCTHTNIYKKYKCEFMCCSLSVCIIYLLYPAKYKWTLYYESLQYSSTLVDIPVLSMKYGRSPILAAPFDPPQSL